MNEFIPGHTSHDTTGLDISSTSIVGDALTNKVHCLLNLTYDKKIDIIMSISRVGGNMGQFIILSPKVL